MALSALITDKKLLYLINVYSLGRDEIMHGPDGDFTYVARYVGVRESRVLHLSASCYN
jgi:hypothetical protein